MLKKSEILLLRKANLGYGNLIDNARRAGIHENTYRYVLDRGYGTKHTISLIRKKLLKNESRPHKPAQNKKGTGVL